MTTHAAAHRAARLLLAACFAAFGFAAGDLSWDGTDGGSLRELAVAPGDAASDVRSCDVPSNEDRTLSFVEATDTDEDDDDDLEERRLREAAMRSVGPPNKWPREARGLALTAITGTLGLVSAFWDELHIARGPPATATATQSC